MTKRMRLLVLATAATFLLGACGTPLYEMTDEEENLVVQGAAYLLSKHNIFQKDGINGTLPPEETEDIGDSGETGTSGPQVGDDTPDVKLISLAASIGCKGLLNVYYEGYSLMDIYQEGTYFFQTADEGTTFVVMRFTLENPGSRPVELNHYDAGYAFYMNFEGGQHIPEKQTLIADSLSTFMGTVPAGGTAPAVLIFQIPKEQAELIENPRIMLEYDHVTYSVSF